MKSIPFYNNNHQAYIKKTYLIDMSKNYAIFEKHLPGKAKVLDLGCGSGRDSEYFLKKGYQVTAMDGSEKMVEHCQSYLDTTVIHSTFESFQTTETYDGIWASASLLHVKRKDIKSVVGKFIEYLKPDGVFFMSFKNHSEDFEFDNRRFTCFDLNQFKHFLSGLEGIDILEMRETDSLQQHNMRWVNAVILKK